MYHDPETVQCFRNLKDRDLLSKTFCKIYALSLLTFLYINAHVYFKITSLKTYWFTYDEPQLAQSFAKREYYDVLGKTFSCTSIQLLAYTQA